VISRRTFDWELNPPRKLARPGVLYPSASELLQTKFNLPTTRTSARSRKRGPVKAGYTKSAQALLRRLDAQGIK
jgi:hypothetical protein